MNREKPSSAKIIRHILLNEIQMPEVIDGMAMLQMDSVNVDLGECCSKIVNDEETNLEEKSVVQIPKRTLRRRTLSTDVNKSSLNRRKNLLPRKRSFSEIETDKDIKDYYLDKNVKKMPNCLETIYEEESSDENSSRIGKRKLRRLIEFTRPTINTKIKKRHAKLKSQGRSPFKTKIKISMETVIDKLNSNHKDHSKNNDTSIS